MSASKKLVGLLATFALASQCPFCVFGVCCSQATWRESVMSSVSCAKVAKLRNEWRGSFVFCMVLLTEATDDAAIGQW